MHSTSSAGSVVPLSYTSSRDASTERYSFGLDTVIVPVISQPESWNVVGTAVTAYSKSCALPAGISADSGLTDFLMSHSYVRSYDAFASLTTESAPCSQTVTVCCAEGLRPGATSTQAVFV